MKSFLTLATFIPLFAACASAPGPERPPADGKGDGSWEHRLVTASDGTTIALDYQVRYENHSSNKPDEIWYMQPFWFNVAGPNVTADSRVRVEFVNKTHYIGQCGLNDYIDQTVFELDLTQEPEGHFSGEVVSEAKLRTSATTTEPLGWHKPILKEAPYCASRHEEGSQIAVVIDGVWLEDAITDSHNFDVKF